VAFFSLVSVLEIEQWKSSVWYTTQRHASFLRHYLNLKTMISMLQVLLVVFLLTHFSANVAFSGDHLDWATDPVIDHGLELSRTRKAANSVWDLWVIIGHTPQRNASLFCMTCCRLLPSDSRQISNLSRASAVDLTTTICQNSKSASRSTLASIPMHVVSWTIVANRGFSS
jgi:hypothetical protein